MKSLIASTLLVGTLLSFGCAARVIIPGPPMARVEVIGVAPSVLHVWDPGHYVRVEGRWEWVDGRWIVAPRRGAMWVPGRWESRRGDWFWVEGRWR
ncbi:MAG TPA: hypothetical protein VEZ11_15645 [Thermoanaerobaculia bacterium]|nr:hypothetical protein [Thermoanaerobaculia bacterium]